MPPLSLAHPVALVAVGLVAALLSYLATPLAARLAIRLGAMDLPDARKVHRQPLPRLGGLAVIGSAGIVLLALVAAPNGVQAPSSIAAVQGLVFGLLPILLVSIWDDMRGVSARWKFLCHALGAAIAVGFGTCLPPTIHVLGVSLEPGWLAAPLSMFWLMLGTSAFNLIDGLDGLSAGLGFISTIALTGVFAIAGQVEMTLVSTVVAGALLGFLPHNVHPARVFLGDTGATAIGFTLANMVLMGGVTLSSGLAVVMPLLIMGLPVADTAVAVFRRLAKRLVSGGAVTVFQADRDHVHHRLLALGVAHARAVWILWGIGALCASIALLSVTLTSQRTGLLLAGLFGAALIGFNRLGYGEFALMRRGLVLRFSNTPVLKKSVFAVLADVVIVAASAYTAVGLKYDDWGLVRYPAEFFSLASALSVTTTASLWVLGLYRGAWRVAALSDFVRLGQSVVVSNVVGFLLVAFVTAAWVHPGLVAILALLQLTMAVGGRMLYRVFAVPGSGAASASEPVLIYGAGRTGEAAVRELRSNTGLDMRPVAFLDDDPRKRYRSVRGIPVVGGLDDLLKAIQESAATKVLVATRHIPTSRLTRCASICETAGVQLLRIGLSISPVPNDRPRPVLLPMPLSGRASRRSSPPSPLGTPSPVANAAGARSPR